MGWFDAVATKYGCMIQGATEAALTLLDVLGYLNEIPVCNRYEINGEATSSFPVTQKLYDAKPVITKLPGWKCDISKIKKYERLPDAAKQYVEFIEDVIRIPIKWISIGPKREDIIIR
jgi:adenylosuccinate synthase